MLGEISTGLNLRVMKQGQDVKPSPPPFLADIVLCWKIYCEDKIYLCNMLH